MSEGPVVVFDGECGFCDASVRWILTHDPEARFRYAASQSAAGRALLAAHAVPVNSPDTVVLIDAAGAWVRSEAVRRILLQLPGTWRFAGVLLGLVPRPLRDLGYRIVAALRTRLFGRVACAVPGPRWKGRLLGEDRAIVPFAQ